MFDVLEERKACVFFLPLCFFNNITEVNRHFNYGFFKLTCAKVEKDAYRNIFIF
jgi:hypothetical protein